jgi:glycosyltransferase involved in cell wall biosynthesis
VSHRIHILYLAVYDPHVPYTGTGARGGEFVNFLAKKNSVDLVYMEGSGHSGDPNLESKFAGRINGVGKKIRIPFTSRGYFLYSRKLYMEAATLLRTSLYDYILADYGLSARYGYMLSRKFKVPLIYCSHNLEYRQYLGKAKKDPRRWFLIPYVYRVEKKGCKKADILIPISEEDACFYSRWVSKEKMVVIPQGFNDSVYNPFYKPQENDPKIVLFFGNYRISTNRDAVRVTRETIVDEVVSRMPNVIFQFVGANPPDEFHHSNFQFTGFVDSVLPYIQKADIVISPMLGGWGMPTKIVESLACGKPVVSTEIGARSVPRYYRRLTVCPVADFAETICMVLKENNPVDACDFEVVKKDFLWERNLALLQARMEERQANNIER